uniref:Uncharacterized protein n=1 Tax=Solanum lycopersicum TaxID=4081 RepID=A0A3Q7I0D1_SOLLC
SVDGGRESWPTMLVQFGQIWAPSNPRGTERLPADIVSSESDLYARRLWGLPHETATAIPASSGTTTCATVLTRAIFAEGCKSVAAGMNAIDLRRGITMAVDSVVTNLKSRARMIRFDVFCRFPYFLPCLCISVFALVVAVGSFWIPLLLMKRGGQVIYGGKLGEKSQTMVDYFQSIPGIPPIPSGYNPATWMLEISTPAA